MIQKLVSKTNDGVDIQFIGDVKIADIQNMVNGCNDGQCNCSCDPSMKNKITDMSVSGENGNVTISLLSDSIEVSEIEQTVQECSI